MSKQASASATPAPSSPQPSESYLSELDGTAPSVLDAGEFKWDATKVDPTSLNLVSWKLDVNARAEDGVDKRGFNAISTVLNHPTKKANPLRGSRKPLPPIIAPPALPRPPPPQYYDSYLQTITPLYESFTSSQASSSSQNLGDLDVKSLTTPVPNLPPLNTIPDLFFDETFNLSNPSTWSDVLSPSPPEAGPSRPRQETLSAQLDTLERHLLHEITLRSNAFFSALSNLQDLHSESSSCLDRIGELQTSLQEVKVQQSQKGLGIIEAQEELRSLRITEKGVKRIGEVEEGLRIATGSVDAGDWAGGLSCLGDLVRWWERHALKRGNTADSTTDSGDLGLPLSTLPALSILPSTIASLTTAIASQLEAALSALLLSILSGEDGHDQQSIGANLASSVEPMLEGLVRCGKTDGIQDVWREVTTTSIREGSRKHLPVSQVEEDGDEDGRPPEARGANLAQSLKSMDHSQFLLLSAQMYTSMLGRLHLIQTVGEQLGITLSSVSGAPILAISDFTPDPPTSRKPVPSSLDLSDSLTAACELANNRASKILAVRSEQHAQLPLEEFVEIFKENWEFVLATETLARRMIVSLRGVTASQARSFLITYHSTRLTQSAKLVEEEIWTQVDVSPQAQHAVNLLIEAAVSDPAECRIPPLTHVNGNGNGTSAAKALNVEDKSFFVVKATAESLVLLKDYLGIVVNLELVVTDVMARIIEFLKSFNSRTCQVVLGAGAMRSAGLKNITAKHLALASQSLSVVVALIPYIREFIRRHLSQKQAVMLTEFDKLKRDYQEHQNEIHAKLVAIMSDRLAVHCASLRDIDWEAVSSREGPREYAEMLVKETTTLHKVLSKYLAIPTVEGVMSEVLAAIVHRLGEEYNKVELKSEDAKKRMTADVNHISSRLGPLSEAGRSVASLETLVRDKSTPRKPMGETMKGLLRRNGSVAVPNGKGKGKEQEGEIELDRNDAVAVVEEGAEEDLNINGVEVVEDAAPTSEETVEPIPQTPPLDSNGLRGQGERLSSEAVTAPETAAISANSAGITHSKEPAEGDDMDLAGSLSEVPPAIPEKDEGEVPPVPGDVQGEPEEVVNRA